MSVRHRPPSTVVACLGLLRGDAVLAGVDLGAAGWAVASRAGLHLLADDAGRSTPWCDVDHGTLDPATRTLTVWWVTGARADLVLPENRDAQAFARVFRERVDQSVVHSAAVRLPAGAGSARVAVRRDAHGGLFTQVLADGVVDLDDQRVRTAVDEAEAQARDATGLPR